MTGFVDGDSGGFGAEVHKHAAQVFLVGGENEVTEGKLSHFITADSEVQLVIEKEVDVAFGCDSACNEVGREAHIAAHGTFGTSYDALIDCVLAGNYGIQVAIRKRTFGHLVTKLAQNVVSDFAVVVELSFYVAAH